MTAASGARAPDAVVVGGGFYGAEIARWLAAERGLRVVLLEAGQRLMGRASYANQARIHAGYHYLRSFTTAYRSRVNFPRFEADFSPAVRSDFDCLYALARRNSKVTPRQAERFCREIGADLASAPEPLRRLFDPRTVEAVYLGRESAFDADVLRTLVEARLAGAGVEVRLGAEVEALEPGPDRVRARGRRGGEAFEITASVAFNCTYSRLQRTLGSGAAPLPLKHEVAELALIEPPPELEGVGVTLMDGPFFSCMPFPARGLHSLSHVRYTPHEAWTEQGSQDPYDRLDADGRERRVSRMVRDAARYLPALASCRPADSLFEVKTVLTSAEVNDGRPILFERHGPHGRMFSVLGGKIDNIYDIIARLEQEPLPKRGEAERP